MTRFVGNPLRGTNFSAAGDEAISARVNGDSVARFRVDAGGRLTWSDGTNAGDTILYRDSADLLKTDDVFQSSAGIVTLTTSGTPTTSLADGAIAIDTTNDKLFFRSSSAWTEVSGGGANVTISDTAPSSPEAGDLWFDSTSGDIYIYYGSQWVDVGGDSVANIAVQSTAPSSPVNGDLWFDTDNGNTYLYYDDGTSGQWVGVGSFPNPFPNDVVFEQNAEVEGTLTANHIHGNIAGSVYLHVKNTSGVTIPAGSPVYATGSVGASGATEVAISDADNASTMPALGIVDSELVANAEGHATVLGVAKNLNTGSYSVNDSLYVSTTGGLTNTRPTGASELVQKIGRVVRSDASTGEILVLGAGRTNDVPNNIVAGGLTIDTDTLHVDATNDRVGIGTTSPETPLNIVTTNKLGATFTGTTDGEGLRVDQSNYTAGNYVSLVEGSYDDGATEPHVRIGAMYDGSGSNLAIGTSNSYGSGITNTAMFIDSFGKVGVGTTSPTQTLDVNGKAIVGGGDNQTPDALGNGHLMIDGSGYTGFASLDGTAMWVGHNSGSRSLYLATDETARVTVTGAGDVGIGKTSPGYKLDVNGNVAMNDTSQIFANWSSGSDIDGLLPGSAFGGVMYTNTSGHFVVGMRNNDTSDSFSIVSGGSNSGGYTSDTTFDLLVANFRGDGNGSIAGTWTTSASDERLKTVTGTITEPLTKISALEGFYFTWNDVASELGLPDADVVQVGVSAQSVLGVMPEAVRTAPISQGKSSETEYYTVMYERLVPLLIEGIKEQQATINTLTARIEALEAG